MRMEDLPGHHLDVLIEVYLLGSKVRRCGRDKYGMDVYVRTGQAEADELAIPEWSTSPDLCERLRALYESQGSALAAATPRECALEVLHRAGVSKKVRKSK